MENRPDEFSIQNDTIICSQVAWDGEKDANA